MLLQEKIALHYESLNATDRRIMNAISSHADFFTHCTAQQAADFCSVSRATLLRAVRKVGIESFAALKYLCARATELPKPDPSASIDSLIQDAESVLSHLLIHSSLNRQAVLLLQSRNVYLYGTGNEQKSIVSYLNSRLLQIGILSRILFDEGEVDFCLPQMNEQDLFILVSLSGSSNSLLHLVSRLGGVKTMSITRLKDNPLAFACDSQLYVSTADLFNGEYELVGGFYTLVDLFCSSAQEEKMKTAKIETNDTAPSVIRQTGTSAGLRKLIVSGWANLSDTDKYIARSLVSGPADLLFLSITECSARLHVSASALSRFAMKLGCSGFAELRAAAGDSTGQETETDLRKSWLKEYQMMFSMFSQTGFEELLERIHQPGRIFVVSPYSRYSTLASEMARMFLPLPKPVFWYSGSEALRLLPFSLEKEDVVFILAPEGADERLAGFLGQALLAGSYTCVISRFSSFISSVQPDLLLQAPGTSLMEEKEFLGPFYVLEELLYLLCRLSFRN